MEYDLEITEYVEKKVAEIMDCPDYETAYVLYGQLLGSLKILVECQLFKYDYEFDEVQRIFDHATNYLQNEFSFIAAYNMRVTID